jgi:hypothetical protein
MTEAAQQAPEAASKKMWARIDALYIAACEAMPADSLLNFAWADFCEGRGRVDEARAVYERLLKVCGRLPSPSRPMLRFFLFC